MIRIIIADDHQMFIDGLKLIIQSFDNIEVVGEALSGEQALELFEKIPAEIAILDINMPGMDGIETAKEIRKKFPEVKVLIVTMYKQKEFITQLVAAGVSGYILKNTGAEELYNAIRVIHEGGEFFGEEITKEILHGMRQHASLPDAPQFSKREKEILTLLAAELTSQEIAGKLFISFNTVESHRRNMLMKAGVKNTAGLIRYGMHIGLI
ncbi:MAG TPA: response regulator transcription factor [Chitinophagales bacterium]|nr:response regulator transcription factor [Chitinophagales bacterium]